MRRSETLDNSTIVFLGVLYPPNVHRFLSVGTRIWGKMDNGRTDHWTTDNRQQTTDNRQQTTDNRQQTTDNRQQTTDIRYCPLSGTFVCQMHLMTSFHVRHKYVMHMSPPRKARSTPRNATHPRTIPTNVLSRDDPGERERTIRTRFQGHMNTVGLAWINGGTQVDSTTSKTVGTANIRPVVGEDLERFGQDSEFISLCSWQGCRKHRVWSFLVVPCCLP